jgi:hypothetical protein
MVGRQGTVAQVALYTGDLLAKAGNVARGRKVDEVQKRLSPAADAAARGAVEARCSAEAGQQARRLDDLLQRAGEGSLSFVE